MEAQDRIVASVQEFLGEVQKLKIEQDALQGFNPAKATYLQSQIFRNFGIIEALLGSCAGARKVIGKTILLSKKELSAGVKELKLMPIPELVTAVNVEEWRDGQWNKTVMEPFPFSQLPPEVRRIILGYLTSPLDKMNFETADPQDGHMMEWNLNSLRLELVLPMLFTRDRSLRYDDTVKLCQASPTLHQVVTNCYKKTLNEYQGEYWMYSVGTSLQPLRDLRSSDFSLNPLPTTIKLALFLDRERQEETIREHLGLLRQVGANIWSLFLLVIKVSSIQHTLETFRKFLQLTPNLRRLEIQIYAGVRYQDDFDELELDDIELPDLPQLQNLQLNTHTSVISSKLLEKYGSAITGIELGYETILPTCPAEESQYPHLINFNSLVGRQDDVTGIIRRLEPFVGAPLKRITLDGGYSRNDAVNFQSVLCTLSRFGDTLEEVSVEFAYKTIIDHEVVKEETLDWLANINFPKVKSLKVINLPKTWAFLLKFPALEEFKFADEVQPDCEHDVSYRNFEDYFDLPDILELSFVKEEMYVSNIWKIFPFLRRIEIDSWDSGPSQVTRDQCVALQRKLANVMQEVGHVDTSIKGPVKTVVQSTDTTLVVEGYVDGNVIQEGNGCILVNGHVRGNLEQHGNGKIFIRGEHQGELMQLGNGSVVSNWGGMNK